MSKLKYVRTKEYNSIIIFPTLINHSVFKHMGIISAGFCYINSKDETVDCFGESVSLKIKCLEDDSYFATKHVFGEED